MSEETDGTDSEKGGPAAPDMSATTDEFVTSQR